MNCFENNICRHESLENIHFILKFKTFVINMCPEFGHRLSGIHKEFKTGHRLKKELNFKTGTYRCLNFSKQSISCKVWFEM